MEYRILQPNEHQPVHTAQSIADHLPINAPKGLIEKALSDAAFPATVDRVAEIQKLLSELRLPQQLPTQQALEVVIEFAEKGLSAALQKDAPPRSPGERRGYCGLSADLTAAVGELLGMRAHVFQVKDLNELRGVPGDASFTHVFSVLSDERDRNFLVDISFCQFMDPRTGQVFRSDTIPTTTPSDLPQQFLQPGFVELTNSVLNDYLQLTTQQGLDARKVSVKQLMNSAPQRDFDRPRPESIAFIDQAKLQERVQAIRAQSPRNFSGLRAFFSHPFRN